MEKIKKLKNKKITQAHRTCAVTVIRYTVSLIIRPPYIYVYNYSLYNLTHKHTHTHTQMH